MMVVSVSDVERGSSLLLVALEALVEAASSSSFRKIGTPGKSLCNKMLLKRFVAP